MIEPLCMSKKTSLSGLLDLITEKFDYDFYFTEQNARIYISDMPTLKRFLKSCREIYVLQDGGDYEGIALLWKSIGGGKERYYVKLKAKTPAIAKNVLTALLWNTQREIYAKIRKDNQFLQVFRNKGFKFLGGRGIQILMMHKPKKEKENIYATADNTNDSRDSY